MLPIAHEVEVYGARGCVTEYLAFKDPILGFFMLRDKVTRRMDQPVRRPWYHSCIRPIGAESA